MNAAPVIDFQFDTDQSLSQLQAAGWAPDAPTLDDQDGVDDLRTVGGALVLTDDDATTGNRWAHTATYPFAALTSGHLRVAAGTGGTYPGNPSHSISVMADGLPIANIVLRNNVNGRLETGGSIASIDDASWHDEFRDFVVQWSVDPDGSNGLVSLSFRSSDGVVTKLVDEPFLNPGVPSGLKLSAGWSSPVDTQLRIDSLSVTPGAVCAEIAPWVHFDITTGATTGDPVMGRINVDASDFGPAPSFEIVGGTGMSLFDVSAVHDSRGHVYGEISVAEGVELSTDATHTLDVRLNQSGVFSEVETLTIEVVPQTAAKQVFDAVLFRTRYRVTDISDVVVADWMSKISANGSFTDLAANDWNGSAARLGSLAEAYAFSTTYAGDATLKSKLYDGVVYWASNVSGDGGSFVNPAWAWPRQIAAVGYFLFDDLEAEKRDSDSAISTRAWEVYDAVIDGSESAVTHLRDSEEHFWGGNLAYRLGAMQTRAAVINDYNRPLTQASGFQRGFVSRASFEDIQSLMIQSFQPSSGPYSVGLTLDGGFSQHVAGGAQRYTFGYGRDWANHVSSASVRFAGTPWVLGQAQYDQLADYYLDGMQWQVFSGQGDYLAQGRAASRARDGANSNADAVLVNLMTTLIDAAGPTNLTRYDEIVAARDAWATVEGHDLTGNVALWNHDSMIHRNEDFYVSTKMNSTRSSGNETGNNNNRSHYLMGDGTTLIMRSGDEYVNARVGWDWHQLPGVTAEARGDALPLRHWNHNNQGLNDFAGVASDGQLGLAAFINDRFDAADSQFSYHTVNAHKGTFFFQNEFVALGSNIDRVGPGQNRSVTTTLNQTEWRDTVTYNVGSGPQTIAQGNHATHSFSLSAPGWFHQDGIGYVIVPAAGQSVTAKLDLRQATADWHEIDYSNAAGDTQTVSLFHLAIDHGINPIDKQYSYVIVPNIPATEMQAYVSAMDLEVAANGANQQAVHQPSSGVTQLAFYQPGSVTLASGLTVTSEQPAVVLLHDDKSEFRVTLADPLHSEQTGLFTITVNRHLQGQDASFDPETGLSTLSLALSNEVMLSGKSVTTTFNQADFGDAPAPYPTLLADDGAHHIARGPTLGDSRDIEADGHPSTTALGDGGDEDGVVIGQISAGNPNAAVNVSLGNAASAKVDAWIDFNRDGDWSDSGEQILESVEVTHAVQTLNFSVPGDLTAGETFARFRISTLGGLDPIGSADDGEVEDYRVEVTSVSPRIEQIVVNEGDPQRSTVSSVRIDFDREVDIDADGGDPFHFFNSGTGEAVTDHSVVEVRDGKTVVEFTFAPGVSVTDFGSLIDGEYRLVTDASRITFGGSPLDGDGDGSGGDDHIFGAIEADRFYRKYGDHNGNGLVELLDFAAFRSTFGTSASDEGFLDGFDSNGDGDINLLDFASFRGNFGS